MTSCVVENIKPLTVQARGTSVEFHGRSAQISAAAIMTKHGESRMFPYGDYGVAVFHDENSNGKMDKYVLGIPLEPYGFQIM